MKKQITFLGGDEAGDVGRTVWGTKATGEVTFPLGQPVLIDTEDAANDTERAFLGHIIKKAEGNPFFKVEDATDKAQKAMHARAAAPAKPARKSRAA